MIGYVTIGSGDVEAALPFYDAVFGAMGRERSFFQGGWAGYGSRGADADTYICPPFNGEPACAGNGIMIAFLAPTREAVDAAHQAALALGGKDEGAPGPRPADSTSFYGAYFRDLTGNKLCVFARS